jgi:hypothetical protein
LKVGGHFGRAFPLVLQRFVPLVLQSDSVGHLYYFSPFVLMISSRAFPLKDGFAAFSCGRQQLRMQDVPVVRFPRTEPSRRACSSNSVSQRQFAIRKQIYRTESPQ